MDNHETRGLFEIYTAIPSADCGVNFWIPNETKISTITHRRMESGQYEPAPLSATLNSSSVIASFPSVRGQHALPEVLLVCQGPLSWDLTPSLRGSLAVWANPSNSPGQAAVVLTTPRRHHDIMMSLSQGTVALSPQTETAEHFQTQNRLSAKRLWAMRRAEARP
jgi:hypothetical protein